MTNAAAVEMLKHLAELDPVPAVSMNRCAGTEFGARARMPSASPANSSTVSPLSLSGSASRRSDRLSFAAKQGSSNSLRHFAKDLRDAPTTQ